MTDKNKTLEIDGPLMRQIVEEQATFKHRAQRIALTVALWAFTAVCTAGACLLYMLAFYYLKITNVL